MASWGNARAPDELAAARGDKVTRMRIVLTTAPVIAVLIMLAAVMAAADVASASAPGLGAQPAEPADPVTPVQEFLLARNMGDFSGAANWCAALLELQDVDGSWFIDAPTTSDWLRQLTDKYLIDVLSQPLADANTVSWTERLTRRGVAFQEALHSSMTVEVHAVVRDGKIAYLSGPYPPIPLRSPGSAAGEPELGGVSSSTASVPPVALFVGSTVGLSLAAILAVRCGPTVCGAVRRGWHSRHQ